VEVNFMDEDLTNFPDPREHAVVILGACANWDEAIEVAHINCDYASTENDRHYWDRVAIAMSAMEPAHA
jgi:hypothetical protein